MILFTSSLILELFIPRYDPVNQSNSLVSNDKERAGGAFCGDMLAGDGYYIYLIPNNKSKHVMRLNPRDGTSSFIGDEFNGDSKWSDAVLGPDGNVYGIPYYHNYILKIHVASQTTSFVGSDLGQDLSKYSDGIVGKDNHIYMIPLRAEFVLKYNPINGMTSNVGESSNIDMKYVLGGALASNGFIYFMPCQAKQVLKVKSWDDWLYLKPRLLVLEQGRAEGRIIQSDDELSIVKHISSFIPLMMYSEQYWKWYKL